MECGNALSSEEHLPLDLVRYARRAEEAGFPFALISEARRTAFEVWPNAGLLSFYERDVLPAARELKASRAEAVHA